MGDQIIRLRNAVALCKAETTEGVDSAPTTSDAFPFEISDVSIGSPYTSEDSNEATGSMVAGAPIIVGQPVPVKFNMRMKGAGAGTTYTASVKPPAHALLQSCGWRGVFTAAVAATALAGGTTTAATLATPFVATAQQYRGMRLLLTGAAAGAHPLVTDYTSGRVATLADVFGAALAATSSAALAANWTYAKTSPGTAAERLADEPSSTLYFYEDMILYKLLGFRGSLKVVASTSKPGFVEVSGFAIWGGQSDADMPTGVSLANQPAPILQMNAAVSQAFGINRKGLPISSFEFDMAADINSYEDPNTPLGFGAAGIEGRAPTLKCDPLKTKLSVRNHLAELESGASYVGAVRVGVSSGNRWSLTFPALTLQGLDMGTRKGARSESLTFRALSPGRDAYGRDGEAILCFD